MKKIVIVDYGLGNLYSVRQACLHLGYDPVVSGDPVEIKMADSLILPGVGAFAVAMESLQRLKIVELLREYVKSGRPLMGICLGMQLLFQQSEEFGLHKGLGFIDGTVVRFPSLYKNRQLRIPNIGWCKLFPDSLSWKDTPLNDIDVETNHMYFIHSYHAVPKHPENLLASSSYNDFSFTSAVCKENIWGFQFHPEKSGEEGLTIYQNFLKL